MGNSVHGTSNNARKRYVPLVGFCLRLRPTVDKQNTPSVPILSLSEYDFASGHNLHLGPCFLLAISPIFFVGCRSAKIRGQLVVRVARRSTCHEARDQKKGWRCEVSIEVVRPRGLSSLFPLSLGKYPNLCFRNAFRKT